MNAKMYRTWILPAVVPIGVIIVTGILVAGIGQLLLNIELENPGSEIGRPELWVATIISILVLAVCGFIATRPAGSLGRWDEELAIGNRPMLAPPLPPPDMMARTGRVGTLADLRPGFTLYARNGALARVVEILPSAREPYGHLRKGLIYAQGLNGANDELWIPGEAVSVVYSETESGFLAIAGDEVEFLGWHRPPSSFRRTPPREEQKLY
jgi:hypothetical protein